MKLYYIISLLVSMSLIHMSNTQAQRIYRAQKRTTQQPVHKPSVLPTNPHRSIQRITKFFKPIKFTRSGIRCWIKHTYNNYSYGQKFLPFNLSHLEDFLTYATRNEQPRLYAQSVMKLFTQKIKAAPFINSYAVEAYLEPILVLLQPCFNVEAEQYAQKKLVKKCLYTYLLKEFSTLKYNPDQALNTLSENILQALQEHEEIDVSIRELQHTITFFLEVLLSKLIWSSTEPDDIWPNIKQIAQYLESYEINSIITPVMLDELFWTILYKFAYFIELNAPELPETFYLTILEDIQNNEELLWTLAEQEDFVTTKWQYLRKSLITSNIACKALRSGLIAPSI